MQPSTEAKADSVEAVTGKKLCQATHELARRGLAGEFGRQMENSPDHLKEQLPGEDTPPNTRYGHAAVVIAENAPLRILPEQLVVGAATYREAPHHATPILNNRSTSHITIGFQQVLTTGYRELNRRVDARLAETDLDAKAHDLLTGMRLSLDAAGIWHRRYCDKLQTLIDSSAGERQQRYAQVLRHLEHVPENPARNFREAVQSLWFMYAFQRLCGNWSGIGRIDVLLGGYLKADLDAGNITLDEARELLAHFWINGTEWIGARDYRNTDGTGDAQHYQNIILAGIDEHGNEVANEVTYLVLDIVAELHISDFPVAVRISNRTPEHLLQRVAEVQRTGGGIVSVYNEDVVIQGMVKLGIPEAEAREFTNDGCWEVLVPGKSAFGYRPFDMLETLQQVLLSGVPYASFDALYGAFTTALTETVAAINDEIDPMFDTGDPAPLLSLFVDDCIARGRGYYDRGARYSIKAPHAGGMADTADSLLAVKVIVFERKLASLDELRDALKNNWDSRPDLLRAVKETVPSYGNGDAQADAMTERLFNDYTGIVGRTPHRNGVYRPAGISTFGREIGWREHRQATASGFRKGDILATNFNPAPGRDTNGPTAALSSYCRMDYTRLPSGGTLELRMHPTAVSGANGLAAMTTLLKVFVQQGGFYLCLDVADVAMLRDAQKRPEHYPNLVVRIAGWCARFHTLSDEWQEMVIQRMEH